MLKIKEKIFSTLKWSEKYTKTDMIYLAKGSFWLNANTIITSILAFILSISFANFIEKDTYGNYQFLLSIGSILGALTLTGMNAAVTQAVARGFDGVLKKSVHSQIKFGLIPFVLGAIISIYYLINNNEGLSISIFIIAILLPIVNTFNTWSPFLNGKKDFKNSFIYNQIINLAYYSSMIACIVFFPNSIILILTNFLILTICNIIIYKMVINKYKPNNKEDESAIDYGKKLSLSSILPTVSTNIDSIVLFHFLGAADLAIYVFASNIPERLSSLIRPLSIMAFPKLAEKPIEESKKILPKKISQLFIVSIIMGILYLISAPLIFHLFFPQYMMSVKYSQIYTIATIISTVASLPIVFLFATRSVNIFKYNLFNPIFNILMTIVFVYFLGIWGAIISKIIGNCFSLIYSYKLGNYND